MTYNTFETSIQTGTPVELYLFTQGTERWTYVSGETEVTYLGLIFEKAPIKRDRIKQTGDVLKDSLSLVFPRDNVFAQQFISFAPEEAVSVSIFRGHYGDPDAQFVTYWKGRIIGAKISGNEITLDCESIFTSIRRPGLRARYELNCRHVLYGGRCGVNREAFKLVSTIASISNEIDVNVNSASSQPDGSYTGGILLAYNGVSRFIVNHVGNVVTINRPLPDLAVGQSVTIYLGCDHLKTTCNDKFNNLDNFGGFPYIPIVNPFGGSSIS